MANDFDLEIKSLSGSRIEIQSTDSNSITGTEKVLIIQSGAAKETTTQDIADLGGGGLPYLVYTALLSQTGTDAPVATVLQNTLGQNVTWTRDSAGLYHAVFDTSVDYTKIFIPGGSNFFGPIGGILIPVITTFELADVGGYVSIYPTDGGGGITCPSILFNTLLPNFSQNTEFVNLFGTSKFYFQFFVYN